MATDIKDSIIQIGLPLDLDVSSTLLQAIGTAYPDAAIVTESEKLGSQDVMQVKIPAKDRPGTVRDLEKIRRVVARLDAGSAGAEATSFDAYGLGVSLPEWFAISAAAGARAFLDQYPDAKNYVTAWVHDAAGEYHVTVRRAEGKSPHELREESEARVASLEAKLRELVVDPADV